MKRRQEEVEQQRKKMEEEREKRQSYLREAQGKGIVSVQIESCYAQMQHEVDQERLVKRLVYYMINSVVNVSILQEREQRRKEREVTLAQKDKDKEIEVIKVSSFTRLSRSLIVRTRLVIWEQRKSEEKCVD